MKPWPHELNIEMNEDGSAGIDDPKPKIPGIDCICSECGAGPKEETE